MLMWLTLPFYDFCGFRFVAVNSVYKLQFFTFIIIMIMMIINDDRPHTRLYLRPAHTGRRHTNTLVAARLQQRQPLPSTDGAAIRRPCILCRCTPCVESVADRTETHAVVDNNIQASSKDIPVQLSTLLPLTIECTIGLIVGGALQMQLLLLLLL